MTDSISSSKRGTAKRLLRILVGGAILATGWLAIDLLTHSDSASASEITDITPSGSPDLVAEVVKPLVTHVAPIAAQVPLEPVVTVGHAAGDAAAAILEPPLAALAPVFEAVAAPLVPVVAGVVGALPAIPQLPILAIESAMLSAGGLDIALATSNTPALPTPADSVPRDLPAVPSPTMDQAGGSAAVLSSAFLAPPGSALRSRVVVGGIPLSPTYGFDTTPD